MLTIDYSDRNQSFVVKEKKCDLLFKTIEQARLYARSQGGDVVETIRVKEQLCKNK